MMGVYQKLLQVQKELLAPKNQHNSYGNYDYRSCEDILKAVKPLLNDAGATIIINDDIVNIGNRFYVKATARFIDIETGEQISNTAFARESEEKKGMDGSQLTGSCSSYARKYCLNGLLLIDDTKDADTDAFQKTTAGKKEEPKKEEPKKEEPKKEEPKAIEDDDFKVMNKQHEWVSIKNLNKESLEFLLRNEGYKDGWVKIKKELAKRG